MFNKKLFEKGTKSFMALVLIPIFVFSLACNKTGTQEEETIFNDNDSAMLQSSLVNLPTSLSTAQSVDSGGTLESIKMLTRGGDDGGGITGIYQGITHYITMADMFKEFAKTLLTDIVKSPLLRKELLNTEIAIPADPSDSNAPKKVKVEQLTGETYQWKLSMYASSDAVQPNMVVRFSIVDSGAKGEILWKMSEEDENLLAVGVSGIMIDRTIDIAFDGTQSIKTLEIKMIQDLSNLESYATNNWDGISDTVRNAIDLGQPSKVLVNVVYNDPQKEYTIYGTSYHSAWATKTALTDEQPMFGDPNRNMYMFKAMSKETTDLKGSKVYLALPYNTVDTIGDTFWDDHSIAGVYTPIFEAQILAMLNDMITKKNDEYNDADLDCGPDGAKYDCEVWEEKAQAVYFVNIIRDILPLDTVVEDYTITLEQLRTFVSAPEDEYNGELKKITQEISYVKNPAFFKEGGLLLGTLNDDGTYNKLDNEAWSVIGSGEDTDLDTLNALSMDNINPYVPTEVVNLTLSVQ